MLRLGLGWAKVADVNLRRILWTTAITTFLNVATNIAIATIQNETRTSPILILGELAIAVLMPCLVILVVFKTNFRQAFIAWLPTLMTSLGYYGLMLLFLRPYVVEIYSITTNAMAPTLLGRHWEGTCPECGSKCFCSPHPRAPNQPIPSTMICENFHVTDTQPQFGTVHSSDRIAVAKYLSPRRWGLVVFYYPGKPSEVYVKRLVGLPGEQLEIKDGSVWIDGKRQTPPDTIRGVEYLSEMPYVNAPLWGSENHPVVLGDDEYFVLGDFSAQSMDSRLWQQGAPGYPPYVVPKSYMVGVVTHTIWPIDRIRIHR